jgi:pyruvate/2-oxoacid:ferredoxin oxidoreductase beta subunit
MTNIKNPENFLIKDEMVHSGALSCRACGWTLLVRHLAEILGEDTVYVVPACCFSIIAGPYPLNMLKGNIVHTVFAAASATATGIRASLDRQGKHDTNVVVMAGDGGTFDIGLQSLSGAASRGENILYICNNNGAYMNTGVQSSTATPYGAVTTTNPNDNYKTIWPKDLIGIIAAHNIPYIATASLAFLDDFRNKIKEAEKEEGFRLIMIDGPCPPGHKTEPSISIELARLAVNTNLYPLYEVRQGNYRINYRPKEKIKVEECMKRQGRFAHLFKNKEQEILDDIQAKTDYNWDKLNKLEQISTESI